MKKIFMVLLFLFAVSCDVRDSGEFLGGDDKKDDENNVKPDTNQTVDDNEKPDEIEEQKPVCGDSKVEGTEVCDTGEKPCSELELGEGTATCKDDCTGWNTENCESQAECGNNTVEGDEQCDGNEKPCSEVGDFTDGTATCGTDCLWDTSSCEKAQPGIVDPICGTNKGNEERNELKSFVEERVLGDSPEPEWVRLSWQSNPAISMTVTWTTRDSSADKMTKSTILRVSKNEDMSDYIEINKDNSGSMIGSARTLPFSSAWRTVHTAEICGLDPDTKYYYQVGGIGADSTENFSETYHFRTAPDPRLPAEDIKFTFIAMGDSRGAPDRLARTMQGAMSKDPLFISFGGDFVDDGTSQKQWDDLFEACKDVLPYIPVLSVVGNHEKNAVNYYAQLALPGNERWYGMVVGNAVFVNLEDCWSGAGMAGSYGIACNGTMTLDKSIGETQKQFMNTLFGANSALPWKFVVHHRPTYSETTDLTHGGSFNSDLKSLWNPVYEQYNVTMVFSGHDHFYQRHKPLIGGNVVDNAAGVHYIVTAGAGASLYDVKNAGTVAVTKSAIHYVAVNIDGKNIDMESVELNSDSGDVVGNIDTLSFSK
ncbi:MAG TPA: metallophosphoesterase family protein [bacterium]|nr:metallophosphoesterase family protein [bacterium]